MNLREKVDLIKTSKDNIKAAIIEKGVTPSGNISTYADAIIDIPTPDNNTNLTVTPAVTSQTIYPTGGSTGFSEVIVNPVTSNIDSNISPGNILEGVTILDVTGELVAPNTQTIEITKNGTYTPASPCNAFSSVDISVQDIGITREVSGSGVYQMPSSTFTFTLPSNVIDVADKALACAFYNCETLTEVDLSYLTAISGSQALSSAFYGCTNLYFVDLSSLITISSASALTSAFYGCTNLYSVDLSSLTTISGRSALQTAFRKCTSLQNVYFENLTTISGSLALGEAFWLCNSLQNVYFPALEDNFGPLTDCFSGMLGGVTNCTVHFPSNLQSVIGSWSDVTNGFNGINTTVLFDLPST